MDPFLVFLVEQKQWLTQTAAASVPRSLSGAALDNHLVAHGLLQRGHVRRGRLEFDVQLTVDAHAAGDGEGTVVAMDPNSLRRTERDTEPDEVVEEDAALEPEAAQQIGGLTLTRVLSRQRKVVCYRAHDATTKEDLVVRTYRFQDANAPAVTTFLQAPIPSAYGARSRLSPYRGRGMGEGLVWISRQYVDGQSLADWIGTEGQLPVATVETVGKQLLLCIANLHERGLAHGALHAKNVILRHAGREPVLTDYALGDMVRELANTRRRASGAVAPELRTAADATSRTDMWSFALLVCEMLAGSIVSTGSGGQAAAHTPAAVIESGLARLEAGSFRKLVEKCASDDPFARPLNGRAGLTLVNLSYVEDATPEAPEELAEPEPEGGRWRLAVASVAAVALAGVGVGWWNDWWQAPVPIETFASEVVADAPAKVHAKGPSAKPTEEWYEAKLVGRESVLPPGCGDANCADCNAAREAWRPIENRRLLRQDLAVATSAMDVAGLVGALRLDGDALLWGNRKLLAGRLARVPANDGTRAWWEARLVEAVAEAGGAANTAEAGSLGGRDVVEQQLELLGQFVEVPPDWTRKFLDEVVAAGKVKTLGPEGVQALWDKAQAWQQSTALEGLRLQLNTRSQQAKRWLLARGSVDRMVGALPRGGLDAVEECADALLSLDLIPAESRFPFVERETMLRSLTDACLGALRDHGKFDPDLPHEATAMVSEKFRAWSADRAESVLNKVVQLQRSPSPALDEAGKSLGEKRKFCNDWCTVRGRWESLTELEKQVGAKFAAEVYDLFQFCVAGQPGAADWRSSLAEAAAWWEGPSVDGRFGATIEASQSVLKKARLRIEVLGALDLVSPWGALTEAEFQGIKSEAAPKLDDGYLLHVDDRERRIGAEVINPSPMLAVTIGARKVYVDLSPYEPTLLKVTHVNAGVDSARVVLSCADAMAKIDGWMRDGGTVKASKLNGYPLQLPTWNELQALIQVAKTSTLLKFEKAPEFCDVGNLGVVSGDTAPELIGLAGPWSYLEGQTSGFAIFSSGGLRLVERGVGLSNVTFRCARNAKPKPPSTPRQ